MKRRLYKDTEDWRKNRYQEDEVEETVFVSLMLVALTITGGIAIVLMLGLLML